MGFFDRLFGRKDDNQQSDYNRQGQQQPYQGSYDYPPQQPYAQQYGQGQPYQRPNNEQSEDQRAIERYRYMLRTAPPELVEQAHEEAFSKLTPQQRRTVLEQLRQSLPEYERNAAGEYGDDPKTLARVATRAEMRNPGTLERAWNNVPPANQAYGYSPGYGGYAMSPGMGIGGMMAGGFLSGLAGMVVGSWIANQFFDNSGYSDGFAQGYAAGENNSNPGSAVMDQGNYDPSYQNPDFASSGSFGDAGYGGYDNQGSFDQSSSSGDYSSLAGGSDSYDMGGYGADPGFDSGGSFGDMGGDVGGGDFGRGDL